MDEISQTLVEELFQSPGDNPGTSSSPINRSCETEIKFRADKATLVAVLASVETTHETGCRPAKLVTTYYDTRERHLRANGAALRVRISENSSRLLCIKWKRNAEDPLFERHEIEVPCSAGIPDLSLFDSATRKRLSKVLNGKQLLPVFETHVRRRTIKLLHRNAEIELAFDTGVIKASTATLPVSELEIELKTGEISSLLDFAQGVAETFNVQLEFESKSDRGYRMASARPPDPIRSKDSEIRPSASFDDLVVRTVTATLAHFTGNWAALRETDAPESVHQLRIALRRMRSVLGVYKRTIPSTELEQIRFEAKRIAAKFGSARECDALLKNALQGPFQSKNSQAQSVERLLEIVRTRRRSEYGAARYTLNERATTLFVLTVQSFVARRALQKRPQSDQHAKTLEAEAFATKALNRLHRRVLKYGKRLPYASDEQRHELRIALKNLRYAAELFANLFDRPVRVQKLLGVVVRLQEILGLSNDIVAAQVFLKSIDPDASSCDSHWAAGYFLGWYGHVTNLAESQLIAGWKDFRHTKVFWHATD